MLNEAEWNEQENPGDKATCELYKHPEHHSCKGTAAPVLREHEYTKIMNYIEAIRLIAEKIKTAESDCIEQLARDVGNYLYDLVKGDINK